MIATLIATMQFIPPNEPMLNEVSKPVPIEQIVLKKHQKTFQEMKDLALSLQGSTGTCVGIAAPQIGIAERFFLMDTNVSSDRTKTHIPVHKIYINPVIVEKSEESTTLPEGCFSSGCISSLVPRSLVIKIQAYEESGKFIETELTGYSARIFQHELDHLDGIRPPERVVSENDLHHVTKEQIQDYRKNWRSWEHKCSFNDWEELIKPVSSS